MLTRVHASFLAVEIRNSFLVACGVLDADFRIAERVNGSPVSGHKVDAESVAPSCEEEA